MDLFTKFIFGAIILILCACVAGLGFVIGDVVYLPIHQSLGQIMVKDYSPAYTTMMPMVVGKNVILMPQSRSESYSVCIYVFDISQTDCRDVSHDAWERAGEGTQVTVAYTKGRFSHKPTITDVAF
ncbi:MAG: hypothetical protein AAB472_01105 [Patescibacteria group bacterium]